MRQAAPWMFWKHGDCRAESQHRWVVVDCETSGMDAAADELLAIGGVAVEIVGATLAVNIADSFEVVLKPARLSDAENVLIHGIGRGAQAQGISPGEGLSGFADWAANAPVVAFHAAFDKAFIDRACRRARIEQPPRSWLDLAQVAPALCPEHRVLRSLDEWLQAFGLETAGRHTATGDAVATALLLARLLAIGRREGVSDFRGLQKIARAGRWIT